MSEGGNFEQQSFTIENETAILPGLDLKDETEVKYLYFEKGLRARTADYTGKEYLFLQDPIIAIPLEGKKDKDGFAPFQFFANADPEIQGKEWVQISKDNFHQRFNLQTNNVLKLIPREGSVREAKKYLKEHRIGLFKKDQ